MHQHKILLLVTLCVGQLLAQQQKGADQVSTSWTDSIWPKQVKHGSLTFTIHQPQVERWDGSRLFAYAAVAATQGEEQNPSYGILNFSAHTLVQRSERTVILDEFKAESIHFPATEQRAQDLRKSLATESITALRTISLDQFEAALAVANQHTQAKSFEVSNVPPRILFEIVPSLLVYIDDTPVYQRVPDTSLRRVLNTRPLLVQDDNGNFFLHVFNGWMEANSLDAYWRLAEKKPRDLNKVLAGAKSNPQVDLLEGQADPATNKKPTLQKGKLPFIVVATTPTELIVSDGEWRYAQIPGGALEYVANTTGHIFHHKTENKIYVLIGGRWFRSSDRQGPWEFVPGTSLPSDFKQIPDDSPKENVKASVPGTTQAQEAVISNMVPQTAVVQRDAAKMTPPVFDGEPKLVPLKGTSLNYVVNTPTPIIEVDSTHFYAVENGVWFRAASVKGPWILADSVPAVIYTIPPEAPLHYVTYVTVYSATPTTVTVGYTPGYFGTVITPGPSPVVVYGTGFYYPPWIGTYWYGPPVTYGFGTSITYTPWTGWTFGFGFGWSWGSAAVTVGWGWGAYPWWGPIGWGWYYPPPIGGVAWGPRGAAAWGPWGGWAATSGNVYGRWGNTGFVTRQSGGYNPWTGNRWGSTVGTSYNSRTGTLAAGQRAGVGNVYTGNYAYGSRGAATNARTGMSASGRRATVGNVYTGNQATVSGGRITNERTGNSVRAGSIRGEDGAVGHIGDNVFATHDGQIYRHSDGAWQQRDNQQQKWNYSAPGAHVQSLDRERQFRDFGSTRSRSFGSFRGGFRGGFRR